MKLTVADVFDVANGVRQYVLCDAGGGPLPAWTPGAHLDITLPDGRLRQYSLCGDPHVRGEYRIAVKRDDTGRGGSRWIHEHVKTGDTLDVSAPENNFPLAASAERHVFVAGGIGITPILPMVRAAKEAGTPFTLHFCAASASAAPLLDEVESLCTNGELVHWFRPSGSPGRFDPAALGALERGTHLYACGPPTLVATVCYTAYRTPWVVVHREKGPPIAKPFVPEPFDVVIHSTGETLHVPADRSALDVLRAHDFRMSFSCERGSCGACETGYRNGMVTHLDCVLSLAGQQDRMMVCVSRAKGAVTLDL